MLPPLGRLILGNSSSYQISHNPVVIDAGTVEAEHALTDALACVNLGQKQNNTPEDRHAPRRRQSIPD
jgi:hypothetical protein